MNRFTRMQRLRYWFDNTLAAGTIALIGWLAVVSTVMILVAALLVHVTGIAPAAEDGSQPGIEALAWSGLMRTLDAGTMGGDQGGWPFLFAMLGITLGGIFVVSTLIGVLTSGLESQIDELRKGRSPVVESDHTVILGWSPEIFTIVQELCAANANRKRACIAILADKDKVEMEDELRLRVPDTGTTHVVCRTGNPADLADLELANPAESRSVIVLNPEGDGGDAHVIKTVLALTNAPDRRSDRYNIVAKLEDGRNLRVAKMVGGDEADFVVAGELIARIAVQTCRQSGLSVVYTELMDFGGDEIYFKLEPSLVGQTFGDAVLAYADSCVIGLRKADGRLALNPPRAEAIAAGDKVIAISADDDTIRLGGQPDVRTDAIRDAATAPATPERTLLLGWNERAKVMLRELDAYVPAGSTTAVVVPSEEVAAEVRALPAAKNSTVQVRVGDITDRDLLDLLDVPSYQHVITLSPADKADPQQADSRSLITLLHLRDISDRAGVDISIVSEMRDVRNRELAAVTRADDFIVSDRLMSLLLAQVSENRELMAIFEDLFDPEGAELYLKPASDYLVAGAEVNFYTVCEAALRRGEVAVGYRRKADAGRPEASYGVVVNPDKASPLKFAAGDRIIVLAEN